MSVLLIVLVLVGAVLGALLWLWLPIVIIPEEVLFPKGKEKKPGLESGKGAPPDSIRRPAETAPGPADEPATHRG